MMTTEHRLDKQNEVCYSWNISTDADETNCHTREKKEASSLSDIMKHDENHLALDLVRDDLFDNKSNKRERFLNIDSKRFKRWISSHREWWPAYLAGAGYQQNCKDFPTLITSYTWLDTQGWIAYYRQQPRQGILLRTLHDGDETGKNQEALRTWQVQDHEVELSG